MFKRKKENLYLVEFNYSSAKCVMDLAPDTWRFLQDSGQLLNFMRVNEYSLLDSSAERLLGKKPEGDDDMKIARSLVGKLPKSETLSLYPECVCLSGAMVVPEKITISSSFMIERIKQIIKT